MTPRVWIKTNAGRKELRIGTALEDLDETPRIVFAKTEERRRIPRLDGRPLTLIDETAGLYFGEAHTITDSGYHEVLAWQVGRVIPERFVFCSREASRRSLLVREMADFVERVGWQPRDLFLHGAIGDTRSRPPGTLLGWITDRLPEVVQATAAILASPAESWRTRRVVRGYARKLDFSATLSRIRANPESMSLRERGLVSTRSGNRYTPEFVVDTETRSTLDTEEHRQLASFMATLTRDLDGLASASLLGGYEESATEWLGELRSLSASTLFKNVSWRRTKSPRPQASEVERQDHRYRRARELHREYLALRSYASSDDPTRVFLEAADKIFEAFCCHAIAAAFDMRLSGSHLRDRVNGCSFEGPSGRLYYDTKPPPHLIRSWRDAGVFPDTSRPDIVLDLAEHGVVLLDAKFKNYEQGGSLGGDLGEMQAYQNSYRIRKSGLLTPYGRPIEVAGDDHLITVTPLRPVPYDRLPELLSQLRSVVLRLANQTSG